MEKQRTNDTTGPQHIKDHKRSHRFRAMLVLRRSLRWVVRRGVGEKRRGEWGEDAVVLQWWRKEWESEGEEIAVVAGLVREREIGRRVEWMELSVGCRRRPREFLVCGAMSVVSRGGVRVVGV
ncbi:hypothetical protein HAX54_001665 [Datura stramonium]|uniref:Uncharacterized protein n=1 Tax=Datura stramonium TaxID=4076 RepID=A0ABS8WTS1_DATST|nr:hypothetical protein [Datura stramonium]